MRAATCLMALLTAACTGLLGKLPTAAAGGGDTIVPNLVGLTREEAFAAVRAAGFTQDVESTRPVACEGAAQVEGKIDCQDPPAGKLVKKYTLVQVNVYAPTRIAGAIVRAQLATLIGKKPDEARAALRKYGHDGEVKVAPNGKRFYEGCGDARVCAFDVPESGMGVHDPITLFVNPGLTIAAP